MDVRDLGTLDGLVDAARLLPELDDTLYELAAALSVAARWIERSDRAGSAVVLFDTHHALRAADGMRSRLRPIVRRMEVRRG